MSKVFLISDPHFDHEKIIEFGGRPYESIEEMNESLIEKWNRTVTKNDMVICLGDWGWRGQKSYEYAKRLNGKIRLVMGNHDSGNIKSLINNFHSVHGSLKKGRLLLTHIPIVYDKYRMWDYIVHGHIHREEDGIKDFRYINVNMDVWDRTEKYAPIPLEEVHALIEERELAHMYNTTLRTYDGTV